MARYNEGYQVEGRLVSFEGASRLGGQQRGASLVADVGRVGHHVMSIAYPARD